MPVFLLGIFNLVPWRAWAVIAGCVVIAIGAWYARDHYINMGKREAIADIDAANAKSQGLASKGMQDVKSCYDGGGVWNRDDGKCDKP